MKKQVHFEIFCQVEHNSHVEKIFYKLPSRYRNYFLLSNELPSDTIQYFECHLVSRHLLIIMSREIYYGSDDLLCSAN